MGDLTKGPHTYGSPIRRGTGNTVTIGKYCSIAEGVVLDSGFNHKYDFISTYPFQRLSSNIISNIEPPNDIVIENDVWLAEDVMIMAGTRIGNGAVVGARAVVTKNTLIFPYEIWAGVPAKKIGQRFTAEQIEKLLKLAWWNKSDEEVKSIAPLLMSNNLEELFKFYNL